VDNGAVVSARELAGVGAAMAARFLRLSVERAREETEARVRASVSFVAPLKTSCLGGWGHGRRTVATARPRVVPGLRPVGHRGSETLNGSQQQ
jgi:hypothetical protein